MSRRGPRPAGGAAARAGAAAEGGQGPSHHAACQVRIKRLDFNKF